MPATAHRLFLAALLIMGPPAAGAVDPWQQLGAGGAKAGRYWRSIEILRNIHSASKQPKEGILGRLALATALELAAPELCQYDTIDPVKRYLAYEKWYLADELEPEQRTALGLDRWEFQHAPAYVIPLGIAYAFFPNNEGLGRSFSLVYYALSAGLLLAISRRLLGPYWCWLALAGYILYLPLLTLRPGSKLKGSEPRFCC